jgi:hypothetical protein
VVIFDFLRIDFHLIPTMNGMEIVDIAVLGIASEYQVIHFGHVKSQNDE